MQAPELKGHGAKYYQGQQEQLLRECLELHENSEAYRKDYIQRRYSHINEAYEANNAVLLAYEILNNLAKC